MNGRANFDLLKLHVLNHRKKRQPTAVRGKIELGACKPLLKIPDGVVTVATFHSKKGRAKT